MIEHDGGARLQAWGLGARSSWEPLVEQARRSSPALHRADRPARPRRASTASCAARASRSSPGPTAWSGWSQDPETDRVLSAIVGAAGLQGHLGGPRGGQDRRPGEQGDAGRRRPARHGPGPAARGDDPAGRQRALGDLPVPAGGQPEGGPAGDPHLVGRPVPGQDAGASWRTSPPRRRSGTRPGGWGRRSRSTRPR